MSGRIHERSHFFKYASFNTAMRVIKSNSFRWSSPTKFNDPFDHQAGFVLAFGRDEFVMAMMASIERIIFSDEDVAVTPSSQFSALTLRLRSIRDRLPREQVLQDLYESALASAEILHGSIGQLNSVVQEQLCHSRVFCVSEKNDNVVMWSHYADEHRGVVFKLRCIDEIDNTLLAARKVDYSDTFLEFLSADQYAQHLTGEAPIDMASLCWSIAFTKHIDWSYEKEWRVHIPLLNEPPGDGYSVYPEDPQVFEAIYLGCRMQPDEISAITSLLKKHLPNTRIYLGKKSTTSFALSFHEVP